MCRKHVFQHPNLGPSLKLENKPKASLHKGLPKRARVTDWLAPCGRLPKAVSVVDAGFRPEFDLCYQASNSAKNVFAKNNSFCDLLKDVALSALIYDSVRLIPRSIPSQVADGDQLTTR